MLQERIAESEGILDELCAQFPLGYRPIIEWKALRVSAGMAYYKAGKIGLSRTIITTSERLTVTLRHEYAHLLAYARAGRKGTGHGAAWCQAMRDLGLDPKVHHNYEVERNKPRQEVRYQCLRCDQLIPLKRRLPRFRIYLHASCGGRLKFIEIAVIRS